MNRPIINISHILFVVNNNIAKTANDPSDIIKDTNSRIGAHHHTDNKKLILDLRSIEPLTGPMMVLPLIFVIVVLQTLAAGAVISAT